MDGDEVQQLRQTVQDYRAMQAEFDLAALNIEDSVYGDDWEGQTWILGQHNFAVFLEDLADSVPEPEHSQYLDEALEAWRAVFGPFPDELFSEKYAAWEFGNILLSVGERLMAHAQRKEGDVRKGLYEEAARAFARALQVFEIAQKSSRPEQQHRGQLESHDPLVEKLIAESKKALADVSKLLSHTSQ
jgi:hypothetical protein